MIFFCHELQSMNTHLPYCQNYFSVWKILFSLVYLTDLTNYLRSSPLASHMRWGKWDFSFTCLLSWWQEVVKSLQVLLFSWATTNQTHLNSNLFSEASDDCKDKYWYCCGLWSCGRALTLPLGTHPCSMWDGTVLSPASVRLEGCSGLPPVPAFRCSAPYILPHRGLPSFLCFQLSVMFKFSAHWVEEQGNEDCIWKLKITDPSTRCYNFSWKTEGEDGKNILVETMQEEVS